MAGEHAPGGTVNGPRPPGFTVKVKFPRTSPRLQISRNPVRFSFVNVTSVTPSPMVTRTPPPGRSGAPTSLGPGATVMPETPNPVGISSRTVTTVPTGTLGPITQYPPGPGPAGTVTVVPAAEKSNGLPIGTPGPATLQILRRAVLSMAVTPLARMYGWPRVPSAAVKLGGGEGMSVAMASGMKLAGQVLNHSWTEQFQLERVPEGPPVSPVSAGLLATIATAPAHGALPETVKLPNPLSTLTGVEGAAEW